MVRAEGDPRNNQRTGRQSGSRLTFILPESFDPGEFLKSSSLLRRFDDARYFVSLILTKLAGRDVDELGVVRLHAKYLKNIMYQVTYAQVIDALLQRGAIERFPYSIGERSYGFRLGNRFLADKHIRIVATDARLIGRWELFRKQASADREARWKPVHRKLALRQKRLEIDGAKARRLLEILPPDCNPFDTQGILVADIERRQFHCNVGRYGRFTNNISNLKRELRTALHVDGEPLSSVDLSCAQPALLAKLIQDVREGKATLTEGAGTKQSKYDSSRGNDLNRYVDLVQSGDFYDFMAEKLSEYRISRDEFKRLFLRDVIAKRGSYRSVVEEKFRELFPSVFRFIRIVNRQNHASLIRLLQQQESQFVIETVAADFVYRRPAMFVIPLHDALYTTPRYIPAIERAFHRGFERTGFRMMLKNAS